MSTGTEPIRIFGAPPSVKERLVGRDELIGVVQASLLNGDDVALFSGLPGAGKTALAAHLVRSPALHERYPDGIYWASLGRDAHALRPKLERWGPGLELDAAKMEALELPDLRQRISDAIGEQRVLLVIDDVWQVADGKLFRVGGSNTARLFTTRFEEIAERFGSNVLRVDELGDDDSLALLRTFAPRVVEDFPEESLKLVQSVGGLPLGIVLIGGYLRRKGKTPSQRTAALEKVMDSQWVLKEPIGDEGLEWEEIKDSLASAIRFSEEELTPQELQQAFRALTVFPPKVNNFGVEAGERVADRDDALDGLTEHGLVDLWDPEHDRFTMHQAIWEYARSDGGDPLAYRRLAQYFVEYVEEHERSEADDAWLGELERDRENVRSAITCAVDAGDAETALRLAGAMFKFWYERSHFAEGLDAAERILALDASKDPQLARERAKVLNDKGNYLYSQGCVDEAEQPYREALEKREALGLEQEAAGSYNNVALIERHRGSYEEAERLLLKALQINVRLGRRDWQAKNLNNLGIVAQRRNDAALAATRQEESREIFAALHDRWGEAMALCDLALARLDLPDIEGARSACQRSLELREEIQDVHGVASSLRGLGLIAAREGDVDTARANLSRALERSAEIDDEYGAAKGLAAMAIHVLRQTEPDRAATLLAAVGTWRERSHLHVPDEERKARADLEAALGNERLAELASAVPPGPLCDLVPGVVGDRG